MRMRQRSARSIHPLTIAAIVAPVGALLVLLLDVLLLTLGPDTIVTFFSTYFSAWMLLAFPLMLAVGFVVGYRARPLVSLSLMLVVIAAERFHGSLLPDGAINLRFDEVLGPAITVGLLLQLWRAGALAKLRETLRAVPGIVPLGLFLVANLIPTLFIMQDRARGFSLYAILVAGFLCYVGIVVLAHRVRRVDDILAPLFIVGALEAAFGLAALGVSVALKQPDLFGVQIEPVTGAVEPYGTMFEGNFFGQYLAAILLIAAVFAIELALRGRLRSRQMAALLLVCALAAAGTLASQARASWLALVAGAIVLVFVWPLRAAVSRAAVSRATTRPRGSARWADIYRWLPSMLMAAVLLVGSVALAALAGTDNALGQRLSTVLDFSTGSGYGRLRVLNLVVSDWHNPILGMGDGSFNLTLPPLPGKPPDAPWIYSMFLAILHDSGILGMALFLWFLWVLFAGLIKTARTSPRRDLQALALGLIAALTVLLIAGQATTSLYLMFVWTFFALAAAVPLLAGNAAPAKRSAGSDAHAAIETLETVRTPAAQPPRGRAAAVRAGAAMDVAALETVPVRTMPAARGRAAAVVAPDTDRAQPRTTSQAGDVIDAIARWLFSDQRLTTILDYAIPVVLGVVALALNMHRLDGFDVWYDEAKSYSYASQSFPTMWHAYFSTGAHLGLSNMTLYYVVLHLWISLLSPAGIVPTATLLRTPSAAFAALSVLVVYALGRRFFGRLAGLVGASLYLFSYLQLYAAQQTRAYALLMLLLCAGWYALLSALDAKPGRQRTWWWVAYTLVMMLALLTHLWCAFVFAAQIVTIGAVLVVPGPLRNRARDSIRHIALSLGVLAIYSAPIYLYGTRDKAGGESVWIPPAHLGDLPGFISFEAGGGRIMPVAIAALVVLAICAAALARHLPFRDWSGRLGDLQWEIDRVAARFLVAPHPGTLALCCWLLVPALLTFAVTQPFFNLHVFYIRYLVAISPPLFLLVGIGVASLRWRVVQYALGAVVIAVALMHVSAYYDSQAAYLDYHTTATWLDQTYAPGDGLVCDQSDTCAIPMQYFLQIDGGPAHFDSDSPGSWTWEPAEGKPTDAAALAAYSAQHARICLLLSADSDTSKAVRQWFDAHGLLDAQTPTQPGLAIRARCYSMRAAQ